ncbi:MAG: hypothetical protein KGM24_14995, partial [Elusimicrobia bacterium]|nr:hypothetical protein [Elusimicrobiota bacterium]
EDCARNLAYWSGRAEDCAPLADETMRSRCRALAGLVAGLRRRSECAASPLCRAVERRPRACVPYASAFSRLVCGRAATEARLDEADRTALGKRRAAEEAEARRQQRAKERAAKASRLSKPQFKKGEPMKSPQDLREVMRRIELGEPPTPPAPKKSAPGAGAAGGDGR